MNIRLLAPCLAAMVSFSACSGGGGSTAAPPSTSSALQHVTGTLTIGLDDAASASSRYRRPAFVSAGTKHAALFINGQTAASGTTTSCTASTGTGTGCTISWSATLAVPASYTFAVEIDSGSTGTPANTVLAEGAGTYAVTAGTNTLSPALSLNGVAANAAFTVTSCGGVSPSSLCNGNVTLSDPTKNAIAYTGATAVPTTGNSPSSGNVYDNGQVTFASNAPTIGTVTGTAQSPFSTAGTNLLTVAGVDTTGIYTYQVTCVAAATGTFGITVGGAASPSGAVTSAELAGQSTPVTYPASGVTTLATAPNFTCTAGVISASTGTLVVN